MYLKKKKKKKKVSHFSKDVNHLLKIVTKVHNCMKKSYTNIKKY